MLIKTFYSLDFPQNCYAVENEDGIFLVDPGEYTEKLALYVKQNSSNIKYILLTHLHFDHIRATAKIKNQCPNAKIVMHSLDANEVNNPQINLAAYFGYQIDDISVDVCCEDLQIITTGATNIRVMHTPGHTEGGVCYIVEDVIFSGDTLFEGSCGRTDFPGGDGNILLNSLKKLKYLDGDFKVYPGHGNPTTLSNEKVFNPYMRNL